MKKIIIIILIMVIVLVGGIEIALTIQNLDNDSSTIEKMKQETNEDMFIFKDGDYEIKLGEEFSKETIEMEEVSYSEIQSCAFNGLDKIYTYENYEITTFPDGDKDRVYTIYFLNEKIQTQEGLKITDDLEKMLEIYGKEYIKSGNQYTYTKGKTNLEFIVENEVITSIQYSYITN